MTDAAAVEPTEQPSIRPGGKSAAAFRTISEVATELNVPSHVLRFWETKFTQIRPMKRGGGPTLLSAGRHRSVAADQVPPLRRRLYDQGRSKVVARWQPKESP